MPIDNLDEAFKRAQNILEKSKLEDKSDFVLDIREIFEDQITDLMEFTMKGVLFTIMEKLMVIFPMIVDWLKSEEAKKLIAASENDDATIEVFHLLIEKDLLTFDLDVSGFFNESEQMRFIGYLIFGIYSYLDVYLSKLYEQIMESNLDEVLKEQIQTNWITRSGSNLIKKNFRSIYKLFLSGDDFNTKLSDSNIGFLPQIFSSILELRHLLAHQSPSFQFNAFKDPKVKPLNDYLRKIKSEIEIDTDLEGIPDGLHMVYDYIMRLFKEKEFILILIERIPKIVLCYVGLVEDILLSSINHD
jgi:hypothetical protein